MSWMRRSGKKRGRVSGMECVGESPQCGASPRPSVLYVSPPGLTSAKPRFSPPFLRPTLELPGRPGSQQVATSHFPAVSRLPGTTKI